MPCHHPGWRCLVPCHHPGRRCLVPCHHPGRRCLVPCHHPGWRCLVPCHHPVWRCLVPCHHPGWRCLVPCHHPGWRCLVPCHHPGRECCTWYSSMSTGEPRFFFGPGSTAALWYMASILAATEQRGSTILEQVEFESKSSFSGCFRKAIFNLLKLCE